MRTLQAWMQRDVRLAICWGLRIAPLGTEDTDAMRREPHRTVPAGRARRSVPVDERTVEDEVLKLPIDEAALLRLRYRRHAAPRSLAETAEMLGISRREATLRQARALRRLRCCSIAFDEDIGWDEV